MQEKPTCRNTKPQKEFQNQRKLRKLIQSRERSPSNKKIIKKTKTKKQFHTPKIKPAKKKFPFPKPRKSSVESRPESQTHYTLNNKYKIYYTQKQHSLRTFSTHISM